MRRIPTAVATWSQVILLGLLLLPRVVAGAEPKQNPPLAPASIAVSREDLEKLRETIKGLHERFEQQGRSLTRISEEVSAIAKRVEDDLKPGTFVETNKGVAALLLRIRDLQEAVGNEARVRERNEAELTERQRLLLAEFKSLNERLGQLERANAEAVEKLRSDVAKARAAAAAPVPATDEHAVGTALIAVAVAGTLVLGVLILVQGHFQRRTADATRVELINNLVQVRDALLPHAATSAVPHGTMAEQRLADLQNELQRLLAQFPSTPPSAVQSDDHTTKHLPSHLSDEIPTVPDASAATLPAGMAAPDSPLAAWRAQLAADLGAGSPELRAVLECWQRLAHVCLPPHPKPIEQVAGAVAPLSQALHAYWDAKAELTEDDRARASSDWIKAVKSLTATAAPKLEIREIVPGSRFDSDSMQTVREGSGNHLNVAAVFSWVVLDRSAERVKVIQRARIATT